MILALALALSGQAADTPDCNGSTDRTVCTAGDSTYTETRLGDRILRFGTDADGTTWREYTNISSDGGTRTEGQDSRGRRWSSVSRPKFGSYGTDRSGKAFSRPPEVEKRDEAAASQAE